MPGRGRWRGKKERERHQRQKERLKMENDRLHRELEDWEDRDAKRRRQEWRVPTAGLRETRCDLPHRDRHQQPNQGLWNHGPPTEHSVIVERPGHLGYQREPRGDLPHDPVRSLNSSSFHDPEPQSTISQSGHPSISQSGHPTISQSIFRERSPYDLGFQRELRSDLPHSSTAHWCPTSPEPPTYEESMAMYPVSPSRCPPEPLSHRPSKHYNITVTGGSLNINTNHTGGPNKKSIPQTGTLKDKERDLRHELTIRSVNHLAKQLSKTSHSEAHPVETDVVANPLVYSLVPVQGGRRLWACACPPPMCFNIPLHPA